MTLCFEDETQGLLPLECESIARNVIEASLDHIGCPFEVLINLLITDEKNIREMNCQFREIDRVTDVLSFPMIDYDAPGDFDFLEAECSDPAYFDPESGELVLGDIVICAQRLLEQAVEYGHSAKREYAFLIAHSMLHLMGYDHMQEDEEKEMFSLQEEILDKIGITRELQ